VNSKLSELPYYLLEASRLFSLQVNGSEEEVDIQLENTFEEIESILDLMDHKIISDDVLVYKRSLRTMYDYWKNRTSVILSLPPATGVQAFSEGSYLRRLSSAMDRQARLLVVSYLSASSEHHHQILLKTQKLSINLLIFSLVLAVLVIVFVEILNRRIVGDIGRLSLASEKLSQNEFEGEPIEPSKFEELDKVINTFNQMQKSIHLYITELEHTAEIERELSNEKFLSLEKDQLLRESQLHSFQMQINPHFLFNSLNIVNRMALKDRNERIIEFISAMSKILRYGLESEGELVSISKEFEILQSYIHIQKVRFGERITFELPDLAEIPDGFCPPMILQPLVENAITHGLRDRENGGILKIDLEMTDDMLKIVILDNGKGISPGVMYASLTGNIVSHDSKKSIGISNIAKRLQLYFNQPNLLRFFPIQEGGTEVHILLPRNKGNTT
jgi:sensor histidine kinase YesM